MTCDQEVAQTRAQRRLLSTLGLLHHAPAQMVYRAMISRGAGCVTCRFNNGNGESGDGGGGKGGARRGGDARSRSVVCGSGVAADGESVCKE